MLSRFIKYYRPHWKLFALDLVCAFLMTGIDLVYPVFTRSFMNDIIPNGKTGLFWKMSIVLLVLFVIRTVFRYIMAYWGHVVGVRMEADMRRDLFNHLQTLDFSFFDKARTGNLMSRIVNDLNRITEAAHHGPEDLFISVIMLVGSFIILVRINVILTLVLFAILPFVLWFAAKKRVKMSSAFRSVRRKVADINSDLENSISGIRVSKAFTNEKYEMTKFKERNRALRLSREGAYQAMAEFITGIDFTSSVLKLVILVIGGLFVFQETITFGDLVAFLLYIQLFLIPIRRFSGFLQQYQQAAAGFERFIEIMDEKPQIEDRDTAERLKDVKGNIVFNNVSFSYDNEEKVLKNINLKVYPGHTVALVGPSGGGKSTLCNLIPRFYEIESGKLTIDGQSVDNIKISSLRRNIGVVQQDVFLFSGTIRENILYGRPDATEDEIIEAAKNANIHKFILSLPNGYDSYVGEKGIRLSGGQKQRISIARVFLKNPPILILDEATSSLDNESEVIIQQALERLSEDRTTLVIAHRLSTIKDADHIVVLTEDGIQEQGTHQQLLGKSGLYASLYNAQFTEYTA